MNAEKIELPRPAFAELVALAVKVRPDWDERDIRGVLANAQANGMTWARVLRVMGRLMSDPETAVAELIPNPLNPTNRGGTPASKDARKAAIEYLSEQPWFRKARPDATDKDGGS